MAIDGYIKSNDLERMVYRKLKEKGITKFDYPINPFELIENENIILQEIPFDDCNIRGMLVHGENVSGILINANRSLVSKRFIAMHELSHYWFHPKKSKTICFEEYSQSRKGAEWQANNAAAYALMPSELLLELYDYCDGNLGYICKELKVSRDSLSYRLNELKPSKAPANNISRGQPDNELAALEYNWLYGGV